MAAEELPEVDQLQLGEDLVTLNLKRNFSKVLIVRINADFEVAGRLIDRKSLPRVKGERLVLDWDLLTKLA